MFPDTFHLLNRLHKYRERELERDKLRYLSGGILLTDIT